MKNHTKFFILFTMAIAALALGLIILSPKPNSGTQQNAVIKQGTSTAIAPVAGIAIGGPYTLTDQDGSARTEQDFKGDYKLIYFGFTYCPAICPTELAKISAVMNQLPEETAEKIQPLFITIDPERDTVEVMKDYISLFHPKLIGLTGTPEQIEAVKDAYRVYAKKVQDETMNDYTMDHSSFIYFMGPEDNLLGMYRIKDTPDYMIEDMTKQMKM